MLHTMINNPRPTRAEVTDIANAIYMRTDALMLSGETASGKYPVEAVETMSQIAEQAEIDAHTQGHVAHPLYDGIEQREYLAKCAIESTEYLGVKGIITDSKTGQTGSPSKCLPRSYAHPCHLSDGQDSAMAQPELWCDTCSTETTGVGRLSVLCRHTYVEAKGLCWYGG